MNGVLLLNKPSGMTSFSAVRQVGRILNEKKSGHTGTLDPEASGLLIVLVGKATKLAPYCIADHKVYHASFSFGKRTDTQDIWGSVIETKQTHAHTIEELQQASIQLTGEIEQVPPMYSAVHVEGKKLYELARKGIEVERKPRKVTVYKLSISEESENHWIMDAEVSGGTYIRTLIHDLGDLVGEFACMTSLERSAIGPLSLSEAQTFEEIKQNPVFLDPVRILSKKWPVVEIDGEEKDVRNGKAIALNSENQQVILRKDGAILAAYEKREDGLYHCVRGLF